MTALLGSYDSRSFPGYIPAVVVNWFHDALEYKTSTNETNGLSQTLQESTINDDRSLQEWSGRKGKENIGMLDNSSLCP